MFPWTHTLQYAPRRGDQTIGYVPSAIIAAITNEQDSPRFRAAMVSAESLLISSVAVLETSHPIAQAFHYARAFRTQHSRKRDLVRAAALADIGVIHA